MQPSLRPYLLLASLAAAVAVPASAQIVNGGFETGDFTGWTLAGNTGDTGVSGTFSEVAPAGGNYQAYFGQVGSIGYLYQTFNDSVRSNTLSFDLFNFGGTPSYFDVLIDGVPLMAPVIDSPGFAYETLTFNFGGSGSDTVAFEFQQDPSYFLLDNVAVTANTPEPSSLVLLGTGILSAAGAARRKFRKA